ncbi:MAG TPA: T9SS type A sorting domain-containing protein [Bacteroidota bacterium]|nr:T9SS type A sorting domain-containing protein [Bacteroidota bacterium]
MMNFKKILVLSVAMLSLLFFTVALGAENPGSGKNDKQSLGKISGTPGWQILNINNLTTWARSDGESNHSPSADNGVHYPIGTGNVVYEDGIVFGSKVYLDAARKTPSQGQKVRVGGSTYLSNVGTKAGYVTGFGASAAAASPDAPDVRFYRIRRDYASMADADLAFDAQTSNELTSIAQVSQAQKDAILAQYDKDWKEWPVDKGAPYIERNGKPGYQAPPAFSATFTVDSLIAGNYDEPGCGDPTTPADQVMWTAYNDLDNAQSLRFEGSSPTGLELQVTSFAYKRTDAMGNCYFKRVRIINRGGIDLGTGTKGSFYLDSMYVCQWSDIDLGNASDDLAGCDSALSMGFVYNGNAVDNTYVKFGLPPPASGYDFLGGPTVPALATDSAVVDFKRVFGKKNLPMSGFSYFSAGSPYTDPAFGNYLNGTGQWWNMLRGFAPLGTLNDPPVYYNYPPTWYPTFFPLSGDPTQPAGPKNFIDGQGQQYSFVLGDRRILLNTGPFQMNPGDVQEVYVGYVCGLGADRLSSVSVLKANDKAVQTTFDLLFKVAKAPQAPVVKVAEMDGEVLLDWGNNSAAVAATENKIADPGHYTFEGYNVYQFPSAGSALQNGKRIATYDVVDGIKVVLNEQFDLTSGAFLKVPIQFGSDNGVKRYFHFTRDYIRDVDKLYNGQQYYLGVTAYSVTSVSGYIAALESNPNIITVVPKVPFGQVANAAFGDTLKPTKLGTSDGYILPIVLAPGSLTGDTYKVTFGTDGTWNVLDVTKGNKVMASGVTNQSGDDAYPIVDGVLVKVFGAPNDCKDFWHTAGPSGALAKPTYAAFAFNTSGFPTTLVGPTGANNTGAVVDRPEADWGGGAWGIHTGGDATSVTDYGYTTRFLPRVFRNDNFSRFVPYDFEMRFTAAGGKALLAFSSGAMINVPFELWNIGVNTPNDASDDFRMIPYVNDEDGSGKYQLMKIDHAISGGDNDPYTSWVYWYEPSNKAAGSAGYNAWVTSGGASGAGGEVMARTVLVNWNGGSISDPTWPANANSTMPKTGNVIRIMSTKPNTPIVSFTYATPAPTTGADQDQASAKKVGVFPNPYYAFNSAETSRFDRFVTFNNLPKNATIRLFNLAGQLVRTLVKSDNSQFLRWDLMNARNYPVASGVYIAYVEMPDVGVTKTLKLSVIQEQEILDLY